MVKEVGYFVGQQEQFSWRCAYMCHIPEYKYMYHLIASHDAIFIIP